ncbi:LuxR C-terminal-related transcriptional regulator [Enterobacter sp. V87_3]|uniref:helix-turn-helix domain-containing protein n=1 Tax=Enterobacter sp. V87_3 TaxID=3044236 RepID=UPI00249E08A5|nr:LuxR C-terminal-related transcriptional regulator [Enterobacter sp. V87_3]MDI3427123.1 LuxR C-terminal-related transcriptional regulator [Enterobacter sp. V87_3]
MFIYQIDHNLSHLVYYAGLRASLDHMASLHPGWGYQLNSVSCMDKKAHLSIVEGFNSDAILQEKRHSLTSPTTLVLVRATQKAFVATLLRDYGCSILCVDEPHFALYDVIENTMKKSRYLSPLIMRMAGIPIRKNGITFTPAERAILAFLRAGWSGVEISRKLYRSEKTISSHKRNIMRKLQVADDLALTKCLHDMGTAA